VQRRPGTIVAGEALEQMTWHCCEQTAFLGPGFADDPLDGAVATFLALALVDLGREREAVAVALTALSKYLPRYNRSVARYAQALTDGVS